MSNIRFLLFVYIILFSFPTFSENYEWKLVWNDEFDYNGLPDSTKWNYDTKGNSYGWGNNEKQWYNSANINNTFVSDGTLKIRAYKEITNNKQYSSGRITTKGKGDWLYGRIEVRAKLPKGKGTWPAIWMLPSNSEYGGWPKSGEIDIMEHVGFDPDTIFSTTHTQVYNHLKGTQKKSRVFCPNATTDFHTYELEWDKNEYRTYLDGKLIFTFKNENKGSAYWPYNKKFYLILNLAIGGGLGGKKGIDDSLFPHTFEIDYVRVYKRINYNKDCRKENKIEKKYSPIMVEAKPWNKLETTTWKLFETRIVSRMSNFIPTENNTINCYGSDISYKTSYNGYFYTKKIDNRWWIIDPMGYRHLNLAVSSIREGKGETNKNAFDKKFSCKTEWMDYTSRILFENGFSGSGAWSDEEAIMKYNELNNRPMSHCIMLNFMATYGRKRGGTYQQAGNIGYPNQTIFVFDPEFKVFCDEYASQVSKYKNDSNLIGYFSDNELPLSIRNLDNYLSLANKNDPGRLAAEKWLSDRGINKLEITDEHRADFAGYVAEEYYRIVSNSLKKYDPNHMYLGSRLHADGKFLKQIISAAGKYCDILSINYYGNWTPDKDFLRFWGEWANKPFIITEFYTKGMDSGLKNDTGAGFCVRTQKDRGYAYQNFVLELLESGNCVGWHWFKYQDNDPTAKGVDPSNLNSNKGFLDNNYDVYKDLSKYMKELNVNVYNLVNYFDNCK